MTSIVIVSWNGLNLTKACLNSLWANTAGKFEVIVIDNGSTDGTKEYLEKSEVERGNLRVIYNKDNLGFIKANNQGILMAKGDYICLLNNDTILTSEWLRKLKRALESDVRVGIVGPYTNFSSGPQQMQVNTRTEKEASEFIKNFKMPERNVDFLVFFCVLIRASLFHKDQCGLLDTDFGMGNFEDDMFCYQAKKLGYQIKIGNCFVWHKGSQSFNKDPQGFTKLLGRNQKLFYKKTGRDIKIGLTLICADSEQPETLRRCLGTIAPYCDEICINFNYKHYPKPWRLKKLLVVLEEFKTIDREIKSW